MTDSAASQTALTSRRSQVTLVAFLAFLSALPYVNTLRNGFVYDDTTQVLANPYIRNFRHLREIFTTTVWSYRGGADAAAVYYRPLMHVVYLACFNLFGPVAAVFHLASILFNAAVVIALFMLTERLFESRTLALAAATVFALHPIHAEAVDWVAAVPDLEVCFFYLLTFWVFLGLPKREEPQIRRPPPDGAQEPGPRHRALLAGLGMSASFILALLSKESALTLPLLATIYEHFYREDRFETRRAKKALRYVVLWILDIIYLAFRLHFWGLARVTRSMPFGEVVIAAVGLVGQYVGKFLWPVRLCAFYVFDPLALPSRVTEGLAALIILTLLFWRLWRSARRVSFGLLWFVVTLTPVLNARWMPANVFNERHLYLPSVGLCWVAGWGATRLFAVAAHRRAARRWAAVMASAALAALAVLRIVTRNRDWHDEITFYTRTLAVSPNAVQMLNNLGQVYYNQGDVQAAEKEWLLASKIAPDYPVLLDNVGLLYMREGRYAEAVDALERSLRQAPNDPLAHLNLGETLYQSGEVQRAEEELRAAVHLAPLNVRARTLLGELYLAEGKYEQAAEQFERSISSLPTSKAVLGEGLAYFQMGKREQAESAFKKAEALDPADSHAHFTLGFFYGQTGRTEEAIKEYERGFKIDPDNLDARVAFQKLKSDNPLTPGPSPQRGRGEK
jgi:tetratricopeptide (TPR) repeat protein